MCRDKRGEDPHPHQMLSACGAEQKYVLRFFPWCGLFIIIIALVLISGAGERERGREQERTRRFFFFFLEIKLRNWTFPTILSLPVLILVNMDSNRNCLINVCLFTAVCMHNHMEGRGVQFSRRMLLYPVWIYFPTLGGEGTFVRVGVKTEFIASWLPPRMRTARMMGHREGPPSQRGTFASAREEEGAPHVAVTTVGCRTSKNWAKASLKVAKIMCMEVV